MLRVSSREEGTPCVRILDLKNEAREVITGDVLLRIKEIVCQPVTNVFSWNIHIQFLPKYGMLSTHISCVLEWCLNSDMR